MSLKLLIDEDSLELLLVTLLRKAGHDVITVNEVGLSGQSDRVVFDYACRQKRLLLTRNYDDFQSLHEANPIHPGICVVYGDANPSKQMSFKAIVKALANLEASGLPLANQFIALNHWNY